MLWIESARYTVKSDTIGGILLTRCSDNASVYFQPGDDAAQLRSELIGADGNAVDDIDPICEAYDAVMTAPDYEALARAAGWDWHYETLRSPGAGFVIGQTATGLLARAAHPYYAASWKEACEQDGLVPSTIRD